MNRVCDRDQIKAPAGISGDEKKIDALLTLAGRVASDRDLDDERKVDLLQLIGSLLGVTPSRDSIAFALRASKPGGVW
jgi:hypothetical protein